jgi:hypothetical protein
MKTTHQIAASFGSSMEAIYNIGKTAKTGLINDFKKGDIICCFAGSPYSTMCIIEIEKDNVNADNVIESISGRSLMPLTSHVISGNWFKIN